MTLREIIESNPVLSVLSICVITFGIGYGANETLMSTMNLKKIDADFFEKLKSDSDKLETITFSYDNLKAEYTQLKTKQIKVHVVDESGDDSERAQSIVEDLEKIKFIDVKPKLTDKETLDGFNVEIGVEILIIHRHAIQDTIDDLTIELIKNYQEKNQNIKIIVYSSSFAESKQTWTDQYFNKLVDNGIHLEKENLIFYPRIGIKDQMNSRYQILLKLLSINH